jgi:hypothetical protein
MTLQVLQFAQYMVVDQCGSKVNQLLTWLAYCHVSLQPIVFNEFVWGEQQQQQRQEEVCNAQQQQQQQRSWAGGAKAPAC